MILSPITAITAQKVAVGIIYSGTDTIGTRLVYQIKEGIRRSSGLRLSNADEPKIGLYIQSWELPTGPSASAIATAYVYYDTRDELFLALQLVGCGGGRVNETAETIVAQLDKHAEKYRK